MSDNQTESPQRRTVTPKELAVVALVVIYLLVSLVILKLYPQLTGGVLFGLFGVIVVAQWWRLPKRQKAAIGAAMEKHDQTLLGKAARFLEYVVFAVLAVALISWLVLKLKGA